MPRPVEVEITREEAAQARDFAEGVCRSYCAGKKEHSRLMAVPGIPPIFADVKAQFVGRICEVGACKALNLDPASALNWDTNEVDPSWDFIHRGKRVDVKGSDHERAALLIVPATKARWIKEITKPPCDILIGAHYRRNHEWRRVYVVGWLRATQFRDLCKWGHPCVEGTPWVRYDHLISIRTGWWNDDDKGQHDARSTNPPDAGTHREINGL